MNFPDGIKITPMLKQYSEWKDKYPGHILMFRMGDFFEMFFDDAVTASEILGLTLTARDHEKNIPMAGIPHHALDMYLGRLISAGQRVAICDQMTEPDGKTIVERSVVRVVTPGTYVPQDAEGDGRLAAAFFAGEFVSVALLTTGTGLLKAGTLRRDDAIDMLLAYRPGEILAARGQEEELSRVLAENLPAYAKQPMLVTRERGEFGAAFASQWLCKRWGVASLMAMGIDDGDAAAGAAAAALRYLEETQFCGAGHVHEIRPITAGNSLTIDSATQMNLELVDGSDSLYSVLDRCRTPMGRRELRDWITRPLMDVEEIKFRQDCIEYFVGDPAFMKKTAEALSRCRDMERALGRLSMKNGNPKDLAAVRDTLAALPPLLTLLKERGGGDLLSLFDDMPDMSELEMLLCRALSDDPPRALSSGGVIRDGFDAELDDAKGAIVHAEENLRAFELRERERTGIKARVGINRVFGYYIEVGKGYSDKVPEDYIRRQTVTGGERFTNDELKEIERRVYSAERDIGVREELLYKGLLARTLERSGDCQAASSAISKIDVLRSLAEASRDNGYVRPFVDKSRIFDVRGMRHPVVEKSLGTTPFTPNDILLDPDGGEAGCVAIITGPNMAGKSTYLRTAALVAIMAHTGSFVPAKSARVGIVDRIFTRIGARDELAKGRSTFMVEMVETANILRHVSPRSLVILDEIGRGTSTFDGMSIAWAVIEFLALNIDGRTKALFATHYHELTNLDLPKLINLSMAVEETKSGIRFLYKVADSPADKSYGVEVARLAGVPNLVIQRAEELLAEFEIDSAKSKENMSGLSRKNLQKEIFFDAEREGIIEELASCEPNATTPLEALGMIVKLRNRSRKILGLK
ncbi:DNA mismatch repair protein MutS [Synergistales bacterium]|nr:DNA mismatch repair protein MutS [Synergistales bacterium]